MTQFEIVKAENGYILWFQGFPKDYPRRSYVFVKLKDLTLWLENNTDKLLKEKQNG